MTSASPSLSGRAEPADRAEREFAPAAQGEFPHVEALEAPVILWSADAGGETRHVSEQWRDVTGGDPLGDWAASIHPDDIEELTRRWSECVATGETYSNEHRIRVRDGSWRRFLARARPIRGEDGRVLRWVGAMTDIEDIVRIRELADAHGAELARLVEARTVDLQAAEQRAEREFQVLRSEQSVRRDYDALYAAYIDNTTDGVFVVSVMPGQPIGVETVNRTMERALGVSRAAIRGKSIADVLPPETAARLMSEIAACAARVEPTRYEQVSTLDGEERVFEVALAPVASGDGKSVRVVGSARDLTERREAEQQLRQAQKMEAVGQLTGGVAHDFNNLLQVVKGNLELLSTELAGLGGPTIERRLRDAMAGADRGAKLTKQLLAFSRRQPLAPKPTDVGALIASMADLFDRTLGDSIEVEIRTEEAGWAALVDPAGLENAVLNLAINARDAMPDGGALSIRVRGVAGRAGEGDRIEIAVRDSGLGMSPTVLARVFEPFFSTKPEGRGTGLGLPQVQGFIEQSQGRIEIRSEIGVGTTVTLGLPRSTEEPAREPEQSSSNAVARGRGERVLLLEDDDDVRLAVLDLLLSLGYAVEATGSTRDATARIESGAAFDLLLSDVVMPGSPSPPDFARLARERLPDLKVLFMSGYAENVIVHQGVVDPDVHLIEKPYRSDELAQKLRQLLDEPGAERPARGPLRILMVEDEPLIAMSIAGLLESFGHVAIEARNGAAAQETITRGEPVDLLLTDLGLPDMDGDALAEWCRAERPSLPIVFVTGRDDYRPTGALGQDRAVAVLAKPFDAESLRRTIEACVAA